MFIQHAYAFTIGAITVGGGASTTEELRPVPAIDFAAFINNLITILAIVAGVLAVIFLIYSGIQYITANGEPTKATAARTGIVNAIIGIVVILLAFSIVHWVVGATLTGTPDGTVIKGGGTGAGTVTPKPSTKPK